MDVVYGPLPAHTLLLRLPSSSSSSPSSPSSPSPSRPPLLVFVHGGAWRSGDKAEYLALADSLAHLTAHAVAVPNYRLTPNAPPKDENDPTYVRHPVHAEDILSALLFLHAWPDAPFDPERISLLGQSCGAHILAALVLDSRSISPSLTPPDPVLCHIRAVVLVEGIYDIDLILSAFPAYRSWFIANAFGSRDTYLPYATSTYPLRASASHIRWLVVHSGGDTLVDPPQAHTMYSHLCQQYQAAGLTPNDFVQSSIGTLTEEHDDVLSSPVFQDMVAGFLSANGT